MEADQILEIDSRHLSFVHFGRMVDLDYLPIVLVWNFQNHLMKRSSSKLEWCQKLSIANKDSKLLRIIQLVSAQKHFLISNPLPKKFYFSNYKLFFLQECIDVKWFIDLMKTISQLFLSITYFVLVAKVSG